MSGLVHPLSPEELMAFADGELQADRVAQAEAHLEQCTECAAAVTEAKELSLRVGNWKVEEAPDRLSDRVLAELRQKGRSAPRRRRLWVYGFSAATAAVFVAVVTIPSLLRSRQAVVTFYSPPLAAPSLSIEAPKAVVWPQQPGQQGQQGAASVRVTPQAEVSTGPMVIRSARVTIVTKDFESARSRIETIVRQYQGYIDELSVRGATPPSRSLSATLRLPASQFDPGLAELRRLGQIKEETQNSSDVTSQYVDLVARLTNARNTERRLLALVRERTGNLKDVVETEREVARVREEIERMEAQQKDLNNKVQFATIRLELSEEYHAQLYEPSAPSTATRLRNAAVEGWQLAEEIALGIALSALWYGPALLLWAALLAPVALFAWRRLRRSLLSYRSSTQ